MLQILSKAKKIAVSSNKLVNILCVGANDEDQFQAIANYGADIITLSEQVQPISLRKRVEVASTVMREMRPELILLPATDTGKALAAILSTRFEIGLTADCIDIELMSDKDFYFSRAALNASVIAKIKCINCDMKMGTIKKDVFMIQEPGDKCIVNVERIDCDTDDTEEQKIQVLESVELKKASRHIDLDKYPIIFGIGRGVKTTNTKEKILKLAEKWGAVVVGTRPLVEEGFIEEERQVGQSGKSISPRLYIGFGISGASQHMVGIKNAKTVIAINNDSNAPIFDYADYPIIADLNVIIDELEKLD